MLILISKKQGLKALTSLIIIALVIIFFMVPGILKGYNPLLITFSTIAFFIIPTLLFSHGLHKKTYVAIAGIIFSVIMIGFMAQIVINIAQLTGINEAETMYINLFGNKIDLIHLLLSAIILGAVGVMDDITITQSSIVYEISKTNKFNAKKLFTKAMRVGNDHISATINTLFLAYTSVSLPLIILISKQQENIFYLINREIIATEIIRIFIGTIGILLTIPITTFLASMVFSRNK
jgi:uncharacterized membrane protein